MSGFDFAIWFDGVEQGKHEFNTNLHVNAWKIGDENTLDIGLLFTVPSQEFTLNLYIPEKKENFLFSSAAEKLFYTDVRWSFFNDVVDISDLVSTDCKLASPQKSGDDKFVILGFTNDNTVPFYNKRDFGTGTILSFPKIFKKIEEQRTKILNDESLLKVYLRFRIEGDFIKAAFTNKILDVSWFQKVTSTVSLFDFSLNRVRKIPELFYTDEPAVLGLLEKFTRVDFFLMINAKEDLELSQRDHDVVQQLEKKKWEKYFEPLKKIPAQESILLYHWKTREKVSEFSLFLKTKKDNFSFKKALLLILIAFIVNVAASMIASYSYEKTSSNSNDCAYNVPLPPVPEGANPSGREP